MYYIQVSSKELKPFDPFEILELGRGATEGEIKKAYRRLSLKYHPDKNPDPTTQQYFAEYITKAYQALTDEASRINYEKYGHPDGPQGINVGVALPEWIFTKDKKTAPLMLLGLVGCGILLPLSLVSWYMLRSNKFAGPNRIMHETLAFYYHSKHCVKESQSLVRIPETLVCAMEFIMLPTPSEQTPALEELRKLVMRYHPDLKEKPLFWKRKASVLKVHMLLLAYLEKEGDNIPANLQADLKFVLQKTPLLLEEMLKIALLPRAPYGYGWLTPAVATVEMMQCITQVVSISARKPQGKSGDNTAPLLQLPYFDDDVLKKLKRRKISSLRELTDMEESERTSVLESFGLTSDQVDEVTSFLSALPTVAMKSSFEVEGEDEIMERDVAKCKVRIVLSRPSHNSDSFEFQPTGKSVRACAPAFPFPRDECWYVMLTDPATNSVLVWAQVNLLEAEAIGYDRPELVDEWNNTSSGDNKAGGEAKKAGSGKPVSKALATANKYINRYEKRANGYYEEGEAEEEEEEVGQLVELLFPAPKAGKHDLVLTCMSNSYVGCDKNLSVKLKVHQLTRAAAEGRDAKALAKQQACCAEHEPSEDEHEREEGSEHAAEEGEEEDYDYDSEESGEEESGEDTEDDEEEDGLKLKQK